MEAVRQGVQQEAPDELIGRKRHKLGLGVMAIILPAEGDFGIGQADQAGVGSAPRRNAGSAPRGQLLSIARSDVGVKPRPQPLGQPRRVGPDRQCACERPGTQGYPRFRVR